MTTTEDVREDYATVYDLIDSSRLEEFDAWLNDYTQKVASKAFNNGYTSGIRITEHVAGRKYNYGK